MVVYMGLAWTPEQRAAQKLALDPNKHDDFIPWEIGSIHKQRNNLLMDLPLIYMRQYTNLSLLF